MNTCKLQAPATYHCLSQSFPSQSCPLVPSSNPPSHLFLLFLVLPSTILSSDSRLLGLPASFLLCTAPFPSHLRFPEILDEIRIPPLTLFSEKHTHQWWRFHWNLERPVLRFLPSPRPCLSPSALQLAPLSDDGTEMFGEAAANMKSNLRGNNYRALPKMQGSLCPADSSAIPACLFTETGREGGSRILWSLATDCLKIILATPISNCHTAHHRS